MNKLTLELNDPKCDLLTIYDHAMGLCKCGSCAQRREFGIGGKPNCNKCCTFTKSQIEDIIGYSFKASADMPLWPKDHEKIDVKLLANLFIRAGLFEKDNSIVGTLDEYYLATRRCKSTCTCELCSILLEDQ